MSGKSKRGKRDGASGESGARNAKGQFLKGSPGGPGRGHRRGPAMAKQRGTPRGVPAGVPIACEAQLELAKAQLARARAELAEANGRLARAGREWSIALRVLESFPEIRRRVLDAVLSPEEAERAAEASGPAAGASVARPGGEPAVPADPGVPLPAEKREPGEPAGQGQQIFDGVKYRPVPPSWGGRIESGRPRIRSRGIPGYGDEGDLSLDD